MMMILSDEQQAQAWNKNKLNCHLNAINENRFASSSECVLEKFIKHFSLECISCYYFYSVIDTSSGLCSLRVICLQHSSSDNSD